MLRLLPFLWTYEVESPEGQSLLHVGYNPKDFLTYHSFVRQLPDEGTVLWANKFTTEAQDPRFFFIFFSLIGALSSLTSVSVEVLVELSRIPLIFVFFMMLWQFLTPILKDNRDRLWAMVLVGASGGVSFIVPLLKNAVSDEVYQKMYQDTWHLSGWSTFGCFHNPLWIMALIIVMWVLGPVLKPGGLQGVKDYLIVGVGFFLTFWTHPYTGIALLGIMGMSPVVTLLGQKTLYFKKNLKIVLSLVPALIICLLIGLWQRGDPVFVQSTKAAFGPQNLSPLWYPLTYGVLLYFIIVGFKDMFKTAHVYRWPLLSWVLAIIVLHSSTLIHGYHYVMFLHLPLCVVAAKKVREFFENKNAVVYVTGALLFSTTIFESYESLNEIKQYNYYPSDYDKIIKELKDKKSANVLGPALLGNILPAQTPHKVWVGHWALTPGYSLRSKGYEMMVSDPQQFNNLKIALKKHRIKYLISTQKQGVQLLPYLTFLKDSKILPAVSLQAKECGDFLIFEIY